MPSPVPTRRRRALLVLVLLGLACVALPQPVRDAVRVVLLDLTAPVLRPLDAAWTASARWLGRRLDVGPDARLLDELEAMQGDLAGREEELVGLRRQLRGMVELQEHLRPPYRAVAARVIGADAVRWRRSLVLDKGRAHGVRAGLVVACGKRLVGRVVSVGRESCRVQALTDPDFRTWVLVGRGDPSQPDGGRVQAVAQGAVSGDLRLALCAAPALLRTGDPVSTSGYDERFPPGLWVGRIIRMEGEGAEGAEAVIAPACDLDGLEEVQVLVPVTVE